MARRTPRPKYRKLEVHVLIIAGMDGAPGYATLLSNAREAIPTLADSVVRLGSKNHGLESIVQRNGGIAMRFFSFTEGNRPDVLNTRRFEIEDSPLTIDQTPVEWTHVVGRPIGDSFMLVIEKFQSGMWPTALEEYLQWLLDRSHRDEQDRPIYTVSVEPKPGHEFLQRIEEMQRITRASIRTARPNPGWMDLESDLAAEAQASNAHKAEISMTAPRNGDLTREQGIVGRIRSLFMAAQLTFASIEGERNGQHERFTSSKLGEYRYVNLPVDGDGKVQPQAAITAMENLLDGLA